MHRLNGKVAVVSGAGSGMGVAHVRALAEHGATIVGFDKQTGEGPALVNELGDDRFRFLTGDVSSSRDWSRVVESCIRAFGEPSVLVNNAGILSLARVDTVSETEYRRVIDVNQIGVFLGMSAIAPVMRARGGGSIINVCSTSGLVAYEDNFAYVASKWAVRGMTKAAALELARDRIRVNTVCPSETDTPMLRNAGEPGTAVAPTDLPFGRWARPEEVADAVVFLASDESSYISGSDLVIDGAYTAG